jgi:hypothetical protein
VAPCNKPAECGSIPCKKNGKPTRRTLRLPPRSALRAQPSASPHPTSRPCHGIRRDTAEVAVAAWQIVRLRPVSLTWHGTASKEQTESDSPSSLPLLRLFSATSSSASASDFLGLRDRAASSSEWIGSLILASLFYFSPCARSLPRPLSSSRIGPTCARESRVRDRALLESV